ncbi:hypothetical protein D3C73_1462820 [compost metagenome]
MQHRRVHGVAEGTQQAALTGRGRFEHAQGLIGVAGDQDAIEAVFVALVIAHRHARRIAKNPGDRRGEAHFA